MLTKLFFVFLAIALTLQPILSSPVCADAAPEASAFTATGGQITSASYALFSSVGQGQPIGIRESPSFLLESGFLTSTSGPLLTGRIKIDPPSQEITHGDSGAFNVSLENVANFGGFEFKLKYKPSIVTVTESDVQLGAFPTSTGREVVKTGPTFTADGEDAVLFFGVVAYGNPPPPRGGGVIATIAFKADGEGATDLDLFDVKVGSADANPLSVEVMDSSITVLPREAKKDIELFVGLNGITYPVKVPDGYTSYDWLTAIGVETEVAKLQRVNAQEGKFETTSWFLGQPAGAKFAIQNPEGYLVSMKAKKTISITNLPITSPLPINLYTGLNLVGLPHLADAASYTSYQLLPAIGSEAEVAKLQRINAQEGKFETTSWFLGQPAGADFAIQNTGGYLVSMKVNKPGWTAPSVSAQTAMAPLTPRHPVAFAPQQPLAASAPEVKDITVTDVTPTSFSVIWSSDQASTGTLKVFDDEAGTIPTAGITIAPQSPNHPPAEDIGVMKVTVTRLSPNKTYYFQTSTTSKSSSQTTLAPASAPFRAVTTEIEQTVVSNDILAKRVFQVDGVAPANGALLVGSVTGAHYPITGWVADGFPSPFAGVDLNNLYSASTHKSLELVGGEAIEFWGFGGLLGQSRQLQTVPSETGGIQQLDDISLPVELSAFTAVIVEGQIVLRWRTASEVNNLGWDIYRSESKNGTYIKITATMIPGAGTSAETHDYQFIDNDVEAGKIYFYYLEDTDFHGRRNRSQIIQASNVRFTTLGKVKHSALHQNFPNPFNPETWIPYQLATDAEVFIHIYTPFGQLVRTMGLGRIAAGFYLTKARAAYWDGTNDQGERLASGVYIYQLQAGDFTVAKRLVILK